MAKTTEITQKETMSLAGKMPLKGVGIAGLEDYDASVLPVPFVRVVQGQSREVAMGDGKDAPEGSFFFNDTREAFPTLTFVILKSKPVTVDFERNGEVKKTPLRKILGMTMDTKRLFVLTLSVTSFMNFGRLIALMRHNGMKAVWERMVTAKTVKTENDKGKFYVVEFALGEKLNKDDEIEMGLAFEQWKDVLERSGETDITHDQDQL